MARFEQSQEIGRTRFVCTCCRVSGATLMLILAPTTCVPDIAGDGGSSADDRPTLVPPDEETCLHEVHREKRGSPYVERPYHRGRGEDSLKHGTFFNAGHIPDICHLPNHFDIGRRRASVMTKPGWGFYNSGGEIEI